MQGYWFDEIESGRKIEEYREDTPFYQSRFIDKKTSKFKTYETVILQEGYHNNARRMIVEVKKIELNGEFIIHLGKIIERQNFDGKPSKKPRKPKDVEYYSKPKKTPKKLLSTVREKRRQR